MKRLERTFSADIVGLILAIVVAVLVNIIASRHSVRGDLTRGRIHSLSEKTRQVLRSTTKRIRISMLTRTPSRFAESLWHECRELLGRFKHYAPNMTTEFVDVDLDPVRAQVIAREFDLSIAELKTGVVVVATGRRHRKISQLALADVAVAPDGTKSVVRLRAEAALLAAVLAVTTESRLPICFSQGEGEAPIDSYEPHGYGKIVDALRREGYTVGARDAEALSLGVKGCEVLVVGGPTIGFAPPAVAAIQRYLDDGGRLFLLLGPLLNRGATRYGDSGFEAMLAQWGIRLPKNVAVDPHNMPGEQPLLTWGTRDGYGQHPVVRSFVGRLTAWPLSREVRSFRPSREQKAPVITAALVRTSAQGWGETDLRSLRGEIPLTKDPKTDKPGPITVALAAEAGRTRIVVFGSERVVLNRRLDRSVQRDYNRDLFLSTVAWLIDQRPRIAVGPQALKQGAFYADAPTRLRVFLACVVAMPLFTALLGFVVWWHRRRRS